MCLREVTYCNVQEGRYICKQAIWSLILNTAFSFIMGLIAVVESIHSTLQICMLVYSFISLLYAVYKMPLYYAQWCWLKSRSDVGVAKVIGVNTKSLYVDGTLWNISYSNSNIIVLDCKTGIAYLPVNNSIKFLEEGG